MLRLALGLIVALSASCAAAPKPEWRAPLAGKWRLAALNVRPEPVLEPVRPQEPEQVLIDLELKPDGAVALEIFVRGAADPGPGKMFEPPEIKATASGTWEVRADATLALEVLLDRDFFKRWAGLEPEGLEILDGPGRVFVDGDRLYWARERAGEGDGADRVYRFERASP